MNTMLKYLLPALALTTVSAVSAEEYQLFTEYNVQHARLSDINYIDNGIGANATYFFDKKETLGPLDEFEYINKVSNVGASAYRMFDTNFGTIGGEYFTDNNFVISGSHSHTQDFHVNTFGVGYLFADNIIVSVDATRPRGGDTTYELSGSYEHKLQGNDYIGFTASVDDDFDIFTLSSKYFTNLGGERYIAVGAGVADYDGTTQWNVAGDYYFNKMTSVGVTYAKDDDFSINAKHFFNKTWALSAGFGSNADDTNAKLYSVSVLGRF